MIALKSIRIDILMNVLCLTSRVADPGYDRPDPDPTTKKKNIRASKKRDSHLTLKNRIYRTSTASGSCLSERPDPDRQPSNARVT